MKNTAGLEVKYDPYACPNGVQPRHAFSQLGARSCRARLWVATSNERCGVEAKWRRGGVQEIWNRWTVAEQNQSRRALYTGHKAYSLSKNGLHQPHSDAKKIRIIITENQWNKKKSVAAG